VQTNAAARTIFPEMVKYWLEWRFADTNSARSGNLRGLKLVCPPTTNARELRGLRKLVKIGT
jgi:hypothetical protein